MKEITLYVTSACPYCRAAVDYVQSHAYPHQVVSLDGNPELRKKVSKENNGWPTVPMILVGEEFIGGYTDMMTLANRGQLEKKLHE